MRVGELGYGDQFRQLGRVGHQFVGPHLAEVRLEGGRHGLLRREHALVRDGAATLHAPQHVVGVADLSPEVIHRPGEGGKLLSQRLAEGLRVTAGPNLNNLRRIVAQVGGSDFL